MLSEPLSHRINRRRRALGLTTAELAGAAGLHPATVHRVIARTTSSPRPATLRKLARALSIPLEELTDQIELDALSESYEPEHPLEDLIIEQFGDVAAVHLKAAATAAVGAMVDVEMGTGRSTDAGSWSPLAEARGQFSRQKCESLLLEQFRRIPRLLQRTAAREAIRAMIAVELRGGRKPSKSLYSRMGHREVRALPVRRKRRAIPPAEES